VGFATHAAVDAHDKGYEVDAMAIKVGAELFILGVLAKHYRMTYFIILYPFILFFFISQEDTL